MDNIKKKRPLCKYVLKHCLIWTFHWIVWYIHTYLSHCVISCFIVPGMFMYKQSDVIIKSRAQNTSLLKMIKHTYFMMGQLMILQLGGAQFSYPCNYPFWNEEKNGKSYKKNCKPKVVHFLTMQHQRQYFCLDVKHTFWFRWIWFMNPISFSWAS